MSGVVFAAGGRLIGPPIDWYLLSPVLILLGGALVLLVVAALTPRWPRHLYSGFTAAVSAAAIVMSLVLWHSIAHSGPRTVVGDAMAVDKLGLFITIVLCASVLLVAPVTDDFLRREEQQGPEIYALYLLAVIGGIVMASANDLIVLFLGLEILSISMYVLAASNRRRAQSQEAGIKYFVLGGFSSAFFLYGVALIYGGAGSTNFSRIVVSFNTAINLGGANRSDALILIGVGLLIVGLGFKAAAVPFHFWSPDVYQGAPTPVSAFLAAAGKAAAFGAMVRVLMQALPHWRDDYRPVVWVLAVLTLVIGSALAVVQNDVKRMMAYSSISHAGFVLVGVEAAVHHAGDADLGDALGTVGLYLLLYAVMIIGTFAVITVVVGRGDSATDISSFRGLASRQPAVAVAMTVLLLSQAGVPLTSGFIAKFGVIQAGVQAHSYSLAVIAMVSAVIAAFVYLRIIVSMWMSDPEPAPGGGAGAVVVPVATSITLVVAVAFTIVLGLFPSWLVDATKTLSHLPVPH